MTTKPVRPAEGGLYVRQAGKLVPADQARRPAPPPAAKPATPADTAKKEK